MCLLLNHFKTLLIIIFLAGICFLSGCLDCEENLYKDEPALDLYFEESEPFNRVYAIKPGPIEEIEGFPHYTLPIDINTDRTIYIFESDIKTDTLELQYQKKIHLVSKTCGFAIKLEDLTVGDLNTFDSVNIGTENNVYIN